MVVDISSLKKEMGKRSCFVEIGHGDMPAFSLLRKVPLADQLYVGLDISADTWERRYCVYHLAKGRKMIDDRREKGLACYWDMMGTNGIIPLTGGSADAVYMQMITNDSMIDCRVKESLIGESARVLRPGGLLAFLNSGSGSRMGDSGDMLIDFPSGWFGMASRSFCVSPDGTLEAGGRRHFRVPALDLGFVPLTLEGHLRFLEEYGAIGVGESRGYFPGINLSVFSRK